MTFNKKPFPPQNLISMWRAEDELIHWATEKIFEEEYLIEHVELIECFMDVIDSLRKITPRDDRHFVLCGLFMRSFDSVGRGLRAAMSGNYSGCAMYARDLLETSFLLNYLFDDAARPEEWLKSDPKTLRGKYAPVEIRKALDTRDGFLERKREQHYKTLSELGVHPTPQSFEMRRDGTRMLNSGPFKNKKLLEECLQELAKSTLLLSSILIDYCKEYPKGAILSSRLSIILQRTREKYFQPKE